MDSEDLRSMLEAAGVDVWSLMDAAIAMASVDHGGELKRRRDGIVERLYAGSSVPPPCRNCNADADASEIMTQSSPSALEEKDPYGGLFEQKKILEITEQLEDPNQTEDSLVELLQNLADMDITFQALQATDIGRHVNQLRKHSSNDVRRLVKLLVRKWKDIVDEWVDLKRPGEPGGVVMGHEDSPQQKMLQNGDRQIPDFACSPNPQSGSSGSERNNIEPQQLKPKAVPHKVLPKPLPSVTTQNRQRGSNFDSDRFASARKRLQENYKDVANAKKQRTIQVMDLHELPKPKPKNPFFGKSKGGSSQGRHW